jgi:hypothetical protein
MQMKYSRHQRGVVTVLVAIALPLLLFIIGMAVDFGHVFVNKTRLQNALDASALSAAIAINADVTHDVAAATAKGIATFNLFKVATGNTELANLNLASSNFEYSKTLKPWGIFNPATDNFAFVRVTSTNMLNVTPLLIRLFRPNDIAIPAIATAGPAGQNCSLAPLVICPSTTTPTNGTPSIGCNTLGCNGLPYKTKICLKGGTNAAKQNTCQQDTSLPNGNFGLLKFNGFSGGSDIRQLLAGTVDTCTNTASWENGNKVGPVSQGIAKRFAADLVQNEYKPPTYPVFPPQGFYPQYVSDTNAQLTQNPIPAGIRNKRVMAVPVVNDCSVATPTIIASSCFFITQQATHQGTVNEIIGELTSQCPGPGNFSPANSTLFAPYLIVLFKSPGSSDS